MENGPAHLDLHGGGPSVPLDDAVSVRMYARSRARARLDIRVTRIGDLSRTRMYVFNLSATEYAQLRAILNA